MKNIKLFFFCFTFMSFLLCSNSLQAAYYMNDSNDSIQCGSGQTCTYTANSTVSFGNSQSRTIKIYCTATERLYANCQGVQYYSVSVDLSKSSKSWLHLSCFTHVGNTYTNWCGKGAELHVNSVSCTMESATTCNPSG